SEYKTAFPLNIIRINDKNISRSRNIGASKAKGAYLFFIDADNYIYPAFIEGVRKYVGNGYEMIIPAIKPDSKKYIYKITYGFVNILVSISNTLNMPFSTGGNFVIKKDKFVKLKGFDETIFVGEDHDIVGKAHRHGVKIGFVTSPKVVFSARRFEKEGFSVLAKYFVSTMYIALFGKITKKIYNYQMGGDYYQKKH
ncbi:MAG: glycosyltransferase, partial [Candidatus Levybacteria bacterium]|nr:glycosyltransferase [Candidatus Levybacteria bacterium]